MEADYKVKLEVFEGPLDLLLYLIKQDEINIYDISLERITRQYLEYIEYRTCRRIHCDGSEPYLPEKPQPVAG